MNQALSFFAAFILISGFSGCKKDKDTFSLGEEVSIPINKSATLKDGNQTVKFEFSDIVEESRCPPKAICIWAGRVAVEIEANQTPLILALGDLKTKPEVEYKQNKKHGNYTIHLVDVLYSGGEANYGKEQKAKITIRVEK